jgi:histone acetyltransferase
MKLAYPASHDQDTLTDSLLALKIARHSSCDSCTTCSGLHPDPAWEIVLDDLSAEPSLVELDQYGSDDEDGQPSYLENCACGHDMYAHGANQPQLGRDEFLRRGRAAIRLDELLQVRNGLPLFLD